MTSESVASVAPSFAITHFATARQPRGLLTVENGDLLVLERGGTSCVSVLWDDDGDGQASDTERACIASSAPGLNHGLAVSSGYLFASSDTAVYRWPFSGSERTDLGQHTIVVENINADGQGGAPRGHHTRTLVFDADATLYVSVGSAGNVDLDSHRSRVRRFFNVTDVNPTTQNFQTGEVWADGLRNEVGLSFDSRGVLWGVENGADCLVRDDMGDVHNDNPGEELNRLDGRGHRFFGAATSPVPPRPAPSHPLPSLTPSICGSASAVGVCGSASPVGGCGSSLVSVEAPCGSPLWKPPVEPPCGTPLWKPPVEAPCPLSEATSDSTPSASASQDTHTAGRSTRCPRPMRVVPPPNGRGPPSCRCGMTRGAETRATCDRRRWCCLHTRRRSTSPSSACASIISPQHRPAPPTLPIAAAGAGVPFRVNGQATRWWRSTAHGTATPRLASR